MSQILDEAPMHQSLQHAMHAIGLSDPNPRVGCVITSVDGRVLACGHTQPAGEAHAEVMALRNAAAAGYDVRGATAWVTLEPCSHFGRTPPCCDALIAAGIAHVVVAVSDPNPAVNGKGIARLRAAGVNVRMAPPAIARAARELNIGFFSRMQRGRPWVRMSASTSIDGRTAFTNEGCPYDTSDQSRTDSHWWRRRAAALLSGIGTMRTDDSHLSVCFVPVSKQPMRVIVDTRLATSPTARVFDVDAPVVIGTATRDPRLSAPLEALGAEVLYLPDSKGMVNLVDLVTELGSRGVNELQVEAGSRLNGSLVSAGLVDEVILYLSPLFVGSGHSIVDLPIREEIYAAQRFSIIEAKLVGGDLRLRFRRQLVGGENEMACSYQVFASEYGF